MNEFQIGERILGPTHPPLVIAAHGATHISMSTTKPAMVRGRRCRGSGCYRKPIDSHGIAATISSETISAPI